MKEPPTLEDIRKETKQRTLCTKCFVKNENSWLRQEIIRLKKQPLTQTGELHRGWDKEMLQRLKEAQTELSKLRTTDEAKLLGENQQLKNKLSDMEFQFKQQLKKINDELIKCKELIINSKFSNPSSEQKEALLKLNINDLINLQLQQPKEEAKETEEVEEENKLGALGETQAKVYQTINKNAPISESDLLEMVGISQPQLNAILHKLSDKGVIKKEANGMYNTY